MIVIIGPVVLLMAMIARLAGALTHGTTTESPVNRETTCWGRNRVHFLVPAFGYRHY